LLRNGFRNICERGRKFAATWSLRSRMRVTQRSVLGALEARFPMLRAAPSATRLPGSADRSCGSSPAKRICPISRRMLRFPTTVASGAEPFVILGATAAVRLLGFTDLGYRSNDANTTDTRVWIS
jgi:hypothetical protein